MHLIGRMWGAGDICPGCKAVTGCDFGWFSVDHMALFAGMKDSLYSQKLCRFWDFCARRFCWFYDLGGRFWLEYFEVVWELVLF